MPPRPPPTPPVLMMLSCAAAVASAWLLIALDQAARALVGGMAGIPSRGFALSPERGWTVVALLDGSAGSVLAWAAAVGAGSLSVIVVTSLAQWLAGGMRGAGLVRGFVLAASAVGLIWIPSALAAGVLSGGDGPASELYRRLGEPQAGRWASLAMGMVVLMVLSAAAAARAVATGRSWIRADSLEFRRRLVRVLAGWPAVAAVLALGLGAGWAKTPWIALWCLAVLAAFQLRTR